MMHTSSLPPAMRRSAFLLGLMCATSLSACSEVSDVWWSRSASGNQSAHMDTARRVPAMNPGSGRQASAPAERSDAMPAVRSETPAMLRTAKAPETPYDRYAADGTELPPKEETADQNSRSWGDRLFGWASRSNEEPAPQPPVFANAKPSVDERKPIRGNPPVSLTTTRTVTLSPMEVRSEASVTTQAPTTPPVAQTSAVAADPAPVTSHTFNAPVDEPATAAPEENKENTSWLHRMFARQEAEPASTPTPEQPAPLLAEPSPTAAATPPAQLAMAESAQDDKKAHYPSLSETPATPSRFESLKEEKDAREKDLTNERVRSGEQKQRLESEPAEAPAAPAPAPSSNATEPQEVLAQMSSPVVAEPPSAPAAREEASLQAQPATPPAESPTADRTATAAEEAPAAKDTAQAVTVEEPARPAPESAPAAPLLAEASPAPLLSETQAQAEESIPVPMPDEKVSVTAATQPAPVTMAAAEPAEETVDAATIASVPSVRTSAKALPDSRYAARRQTLAQHSNH